MKHLWTACMECLHIAAHQALACWLSIHLLLGLTVHCMWPGLCMVKLEAKLFTGRFQCTHCAHLRSFHVSAHYLLMGWLLGAVMS